MKNNKTVNRQAVPGKTQRTRSKLVDAIREEIVVTGSFSAESVATRAGIATATFYNHFATKDEALSAAYEQLMGDLVALVQQQCEIENLLDLGLSDLVENWVADTANFFKHNAALFRIAQAAIERSKPMRDLFRDHESQVTESYRQFIERGQAASLIRDGHPAVMAKVLTVFSESLNHPLVQRIETGDEFHQEIADAIAGILRRRTGMENGKGRT